MPGDFCPAAGPRRFTRGFLATITAFYQHLLRHTSNAPVATDMSAAADRAVNLVESAMHNDGGSVGAEAEALHGGRGGLRFVARRHG
jgi:hypothetical protein